MDLVYSWRHYVRDGWAKNESLDISISYLDLSTPESFTESIQYHIKNIDNLKKMHKDVVDSLNYAHENLMTRKQILFITEICQRIKKYMNEFDCESSTIICFFTNPMMWEQDYPLSSWKYKSLAIPDHLIADGFIRYITFDNQEDAILHILEHNSHFILSKELTPTSKNV